MSTIAKVLREELAVNPPNDDEGHLRCTCDDCCADVSALLIPRSELGDIFKQLAAASYFLPIMESEQNGLPMTAFKNALHRLHVAAATPYPSSATPEKPE